VMPGQRTKQGPVQYHSARVRDDRRSRPAEEGSRFSVLSKPRPVQAH
jgi:hypothetical protein